MVVCAIFSETLGTLLQTIPRDLAQVNRGVSLFLVGIHHFWRAKHPHLNQLGFINTGSTVISICKTAILLRMGMIKPNINISRNSRTSVLRTPPEQ